MAFEQDAYRAALASVRRAGVALTAVQIRALQRAYGATLLRIGEAIGDSTNPLAVTRLQGVQREIRAILAGMQRQLTSIANRGVEVTASTVVDIHRTVLADLSSHYGVTGLTSRLGGTSARAALAAIRGPGAGTFNSLYRRHLEQSVPQIDALLEASAAQGVAAGQLADDLLTIMAQNEPGILRITPSLSVLHRGGFGALDLSKYAMDDGDVAKVRTMLYDARRIAVSQTNNALREGNRQSMIDSGIVVAAKWQLSGRHDKPDECDEIAEADVGYGPGMYPPEDWPEHPHPFCACAQGGPVRTLRPSEWGVREEEEEAA